MSLNQITKKNLPHLKNIQFWRIRIDVAEISAIL